MIRQPWLFFLLLVGCGGGSVPAPSLSSPTPTPLGVVSINFDDGYESAFVNGMPIIDAAGLHTTQFIVTHKFGVTGYISGSQMLAMQASGHEIGAHTRTHPHLTKFTEAQQHFEIDGSLYDLEVNWNISAKVFAYPYGDYNDTTVAIVKADGFTGARTTNQGFNDNSSQPLLLKCFIIDDRNISDINQITQAIDDAAANGTWLILLFHRVDETGNPISISHVVIQQTVDHLVQNKVRVVTMSEGLALYHLNSAPRFR